MLQRCSLAISFTLCLLGWRQSPAESFRSGARAITFETFSEVGEGSPPVLILLPGSSGPAEPFYRSQATWFAHQGYTVRLLHYFDATTSRLPGIDNYHSWVLAVVDFVALQKQSTPSVFVLGYSLGASVALAAGSQNLPVEAVAEWYGSLPDEYFEHLKGMPPLLILHGARDQNIPVGNAEQLQRLCDLKEFECSVNIYSDQEHGFAGAALEDAEQRTKAFFAKHSHRK